MADLQSIITYNPVAIERSADLQEALRMLDEMDFHHLPVVDDERNLVGMVSDVDLVLAVEHCIHAACAAVGPAETEWKPLAIEGLMTPQLITVDIGDSQRNGLERMLENRIHSLPVLNGGRLKAIVTSTDFVREFSFGASDTAGDTAGTLADANPEVIDADASLEEAVAAMTAAGVDSVSVRQGDLPLGVLSHRDLRKARCAQVCRELFGARLLANQPASIAELLAKSPTVMAGESLHKAAAVMHEHRRQAIAVVNGANRHVGVLTEEALLQAMLKQLA